MHPSSRSEAAFEPSLMIFRLRFRALFHIPIKSTPIFSLNHGKLPSNVCCLQFCVPVKNGGGALPRDTQGGPFTPNSGVFQITQDTLPIHIAIIAHTAVHVTITFRLQSFSLYFPIEQSNA